MWRGSGRDEKEGKRERSDEEKRVRGEGGGVTRGKDGRQDMLLPICVWPVGLKHFDPALVS